jgi:hypothetical protein
MSAKFCEACQAYTFNGDAHVCTTYDGPPCVTCGEPTVFYNVGAPGYGAGRMCRHGHDEQITRHGINTPEDVR